MGSIDLTGQTFEKMTVLRCLGKGPRGTEWACICDCGNECIRTTGALRFGKTKSCGCLLRRNSVKAGDRFERLTALQESVKDPRYTGRTWLCRCDCGKEVLAWTGNLKSGNTKSCGCLQAELTIERNRLDRHRTHGHAGIGAHTRTYRSWQALRQRCDNPKRHNYVRYGGRGIAYDPRWSKFEVFLDEMGERPEGKTLDRENNALGYSKANCRWATPKEQQNNREVSIHAQY